MGSGDCGDQAEGKVGRNRGKGERKGRCRLSEVRDPSAALTFSRTDAVHVTSALGCGKATKQDAPSLAVHAAQPHMYPKATMPSCILQSALSVCFLIMQCQHALYTRQFGLGKVSPLSG